MNHSKKVTKAATLAGCLMPALAHAHAGHAGGLATGVAHPLSGVDHVMVLFGVGLWAARMGGGSRVTVLLAFLSAMAAGGALGFMGVALPGTEQAVAASVLIVGLILAAGGRVPVAAATAMVVTFALFHGLVHWNEMPPAADARGYAVGLLLSSAAVLVCGLGLGTFGAQAGRSTWIRFAGAMIFTAGLLSSPGPI